jgi:sec-independent protein translocase protein TatA
MIGDLFDSPWKILIVVVVLIVLFGSKKLPHAARSLGQSMRILKAEVSGLHQDEPESGASAQDLGSTDTGFPAPAELATGQQPGQQAQIDALQRQTRDLQRAAAMDAAAPTVPAGASAESQRTQQPS